MPVQQAPNRAAPAARTLRRASAVLVVASALLISPNLLVSAATAQTASASSPGAIDTVALVNPLVGTAGGSATEYGGMVPSAAPPFAMTKWTPATRENRVSRVPYHSTDTKVGGFIGSHQPAIWMGDWGYVTVMPGSGAIKTRFSDRSLSFDRATEKSTASEYDVVLNASGGGTIASRLTGTSRVGYLEFGFDGTTTPNVLLQATRAGINGEVNVDPASQEITGYNPDRQDSKLGPFKAPGFKGYFVARFDTPFTSHGTANGTTVHEGAAAGAGADLSAYVRFADGTEKVNVRVGVSLISVEQARENLDREAPDGTTFDTIAQQTRDAWSEKLDRVQITGGTDDQRASFYTSLYHALQYPAEIDEYGSYYSAYDDRVHEGDDAYTAYSLWDTFRAQNALLTLMAPERVDGMVTSMLQSYQQGGWLPMWQNLTETNIMVGSHSDSIIAEAVSKGFTGFDLDLAYEAVYKNAMTPPDQDTTLWYGDRQENTPVEARAGLTTYMANGWVANDRTAEAASRTLDYAYDDSAVSIVADAAGHADDAEFFTERSKSYKNLWNPATGFMQGRNFDGSWSAGGWTEGGQWQYTFDVMHDVDGLVQLMGDDLFRSRLDETLASHNAHDNEPSHHISYLPAMTGQPWKTQEAVRAVAAAHYSNAIDGLSGNDDLGQMSAWYVFSAMGFYPVNAASDEYVVGTPLFDEMTIDLPGGAQPLVISGAGAATRKYVHALSLNGNPISEPVLTQAQLTGGGALSFELRNVPQAWGATTDVPAPTAANVARGSAATMFNGTPAVSWGKPVSNAVDGNVRSMAQSLTDAPWGLNVDLRESHVIDRVVVHPDWENYPVDYSIAVSVDGNEWTTVGTVEQAGTDTGCPQGTRCGARTETTFDPIAARFVKLTVDSWTSAIKGNPPLGYGWGLNEFEVYEMLDTAGPAVEIEMPVPEESGWYTATPSVTIAATDDSGIESIEYRLDGGSWSDYVEPVVLEDGTHSIEARATDTAGNRSEAISKGDLQVDTVAPATEAILSTEFSGTTAKKKGTISFAASDATSGVASTSYRVNGGGWVHGDSVVLDRKGSYTIEFRSTDAAGNLESKQSITVTIGKEKPKK